MAVVGNLAIGMSADSSKFAKDMSKASASLKFFEMATDRAKSALAGFSAKAAAGIGVAVGAGLGVATVAVGELVMSGAKLNATISKSKVIFGDASSSIVTEAQAMADKFGIVKAEFIDAAASFGSAFQQAGKPAKEASELGVKMAKLGLDMASLEGVNATNADAFQALSSAMKGEMDPIERFNVTLNAEKIAAEALALGLAKNKNEITDLAKKTAILSLVMKSTTKAQGDLERTAGEADNQIKALGGRFENLKADMGMAFQPATEAILKLVNTGFKVLEEEIARNQGAIKEWATEAASSGGSIQGAVGNMGAAIGHVADGLHILKTQFLTVEVLGASVPANIAAAFGKLATVFNDISSAIRGKPLFDKGTIDAWTAPFTDKARDLMKELGDHMAAGMPSEKINAAFAKIGSGVGAVAQKMGEAANATDRNSAAMEQANAKAQKLGAGVGELEKKLTLENATFGMTSTQADIYKLSQEGASDAQLAGVRAAAAQHEALEQGKKDFDANASAAKSLIEETRTPFEKFEAEIEKLNKLQDAGLIDQDTYGRGAEKAEKELDGKDSPKSKFSEAQDVNSQGARDTMLRFTESAQPQDATKDIAASNKQQVDLQTKMLEALQRMAGKAGAAIGEALGGDQYSVGFP